MTTKYFLAPNARWQGRNLTGQPAIGGKLYTYVNHTSTPKTTYQDKDGNVSNTNPVILDGKGEANIYWASDDLYTIELYTSSDQLVYTQDNYPYVDSDGREISSSTIVTNLVRNPQFTWWSNTTSFSPVNNSVNANDYVADDWIFSRDATSSVIEISRGEFAPDDTAVPGTPVYYLHYNATSAGGGETYRRLSQSFQGVRSLAGQNVAISFYAKRSTTPVTLGATLRQYFGSGGSSEVKTGVINPTFLTEGWAQYKAAILIPSVAGKTIGAGNALFLDLDFGPNTTGIIDIANIEMQVGTAITPSPYQTVDEQFKYLDTTVNESVVSTGSYQHTIATIAPPGWVMCNDGTIGNPISGANTALVRCKALFTMLWENILNPSASGPIYVPIYNSDGTLGTKSGSAEADWNANKRLSLTKALGRVLAGANPIPTVLSTKVITASNDGHGNLLLTVDSTQGIYNGTKVRFANTGGSLPGNLVAATDYYCVVASSTTFYVGATTGSGSYVNALNGANEFFVGGAAALTNMVAFSTAGTGTNMVSVQATAHALASYTGEDSVAPIIPEMAIHNHTVTLSGGNTLVIGRTAGTVEPSVGVGDWKLDTTISISNSGDGQPHNNLAPTTYTNIMLKL